MNAQAVGIDLGTTYSCIAYLNQHGTPITLPNQEGELSTPSVVLFDADEVVVGTEALRNSIVSPERVVTHAKRYIGDSYKQYPIDRDFYTPVDISAIILRKLLDAAEDQIGKVTRAVITVPAQFSDTQRQNTIEAGLKAGLDRVDIINEPIAAALCYVLGTEGLWFSELAEEQRIMVYDLGGGTFDLSVVKYRQDEVTVIASGGDLKLGGIDWNKALEIATCESFYREFDADPRLDPSSMQSLSLEVEQTKRSLSMRPKATLTCHHGGFRKSYQISQDQFRQLTKPLVDKTEKITLGLLKNHRLGWAHIDAVLTVGGASRMPMIRDMLKGLSGRTLNTSLSPDQSIAHGAAYYAGMLLSNTDFARSLLSSEATARLSKMRQNSVNARALGFLVKDPDTQQRFPHYLLPANTSLPAEAKHVYGTMIANQRQVCLRLIESGGSSEEQYSELGLCEVAALPPNLPIGSAIEVTLKYDEQARVHVTARDVTSGQVAETQITRKENLIAEQLARQQQPVPQEETAQAAPQTQAKTAQKSEARLIDMGEILDAAPYADEIGKDLTIQKSSGVSAKPKPSRPKPPEDDGITDIDFPDTDMPIPLCNECGEPLNARLQCTHCVPKQATTPSPKREPSSSTTKRRKQTSGKKVAAEAKSRGKRPQKSVSSQGKKTLSLPSDGEIIDLHSPPKNRPTSNKPNKRQRP